MEHVLIEGDSISIKKGAIALSYPPRVRVRATIGGGGYESAIAPKKGYSKFSRNFIETIKSI